MKKINIHIVWTLQGKISDEVESFQEIIFDILSGLYVNQHQTTRILHAELYFFSVMPRVPQHISGTKRAIRDPLVLKQAIFFKDFFDFLKHWIFYLCICVFFL